MEDVADEQGVPPKYLPQILIELKSRGIVRSVRGKEGGYLLARPPAEITLGDVLRAAEGPLFDTPALNDPRCPPELRRAWEQYLAEIDDADLNIEIAYTNSQGEHYRNEVRDILMHVLMHGVYHRGQIAAAVRDRAGEPAYTDFIEAVRKGKLAVASSEL